MMREKRRREEAAAESDEEEVRWAHPPIGVAHTESSSRRCLARHTRAGREWRSDDLLVSLTCSKRLCVHAAAKTLARLAREEMGRHETGGGRDEAKAQWALPALLARVGRSIDSTPETQTSASISIIECSAAPSPPRPLLHAAAAVAFLTQLHRIVQPSSTSDEFRSDEDKQQSADTNGIVVEHYLKHVGTFLATLCDAFNSQSDIVDWGDLLEYLRDLAHLILARGSPDDRATFLRALAPHMEKFLCTQYAALRSTSRLFLVAFFQIDLQEENSSGPGAITHQQLPALLHASLRTDSRMVAANTGPDVTEMSDAEESESLDEEERDSAERTEWLLRCILLRIAFRTVLDHPSLDDMQIIEALHVRMQLHEQSPHDFRTRLFELVSDADDSLIDTLLHLLHAHASLSEIKTASAASSPLAVVLSALHPFSLFYRLLAALSFDHSSLLDFLISNETNFLTYLTHILRRVNRSGARLESDQLHVETPFEELARRCEEERAADAAEDDADDSSSSSASSSGFAIGLVMDCLIRLALSLTRLDSKGLFPYPIQPLLRALKQVEQQYEAHEASTARDRERSG